MTGENGKTRGVPSASERAIAGLLLGVSAPLLLAAGAAIKADDGGPVFFRQSRVGRARREFDVVKLRTMRDGRVTRAGQWLRRLKLDELPQLVNVIRGEMRLTGPRPITKADADRLGWIGPASDGRWAVPPGITGPTQLSAICDAERALARDLAYARDATSLDALELVVLSVLAPITGRGMIASRVERWR